MYACVRQHNMRFAKIARVVSGFPREVAEDRDFHVRPMLPHHSARFIAHEQLLLWSLSRRRTVFSFSFISIGKRRFVAD